MRWVLSNLVGTKSNALLKLRLIRAGQLFCYRRMTFRTRRCMTSLSARYKCTSIIRQYLLSLELTFTRYPQLRTGSRSRKCNI